MEIVKDAAYQQHLFGDLYRNLTAQVHLKVWRNVKFYEILHYLFKQICYKNYVTHMLKKVKTDLLPK